MSSKIYIHMEWGTVLRAFIVIHSFTRTLTQRLTIYIHTIIICSPKHKILINQMHSNHYMFYLNKRV